MERILLWLIGVDQSDAGRAANWSVELLKPIPLWLVFMFIVPAVGFWTWRLYRQETGFLTPVRRGGLMGLRLAAFGVLILVLLQPVVSLDLESSLHGVVLVLVDDSKSMGLKDDRYPPDEVEALARVTGLERREIRKKTRSELVRAWLQKSDHQILRQVSKRSDLRLYRFSSKIDRIEKQGIGALKADGPSTRLGDSILEALRDARGKRVNAILVISDGRSNAGLTVGYVAKSLAARRPAIPVYTVGVGSPRPPRDVNLVKVDTEPVVLKDEEIVFDVELTHTGYKGYPVKISLLDETGRPVAVKEITLGEDGVRVRDQLVTRADRVGDRTYRVQVARMPGEVSEDNNARSRTVRVIDKKIKVLFVEGVPRSEYIFLKSALIRDPKLHAYCWLASADPNFPQELSLELLRKGEPGLRHFPGELKDLVKYDVILLGDVDLKRLGEPRRATDPAFDWRTIGENLRRFVEDFGGAIIFLGGHEFNPWSYRDTPLEALLPVKIPGSDPLRGRVFKEPFRPRLTAHGRGDPILRLKADEEKNVKYWEEPGGLPPLYWYTPVKEAKPAARLLLRHPNGSILMAVQLYGRGRTMYVGTDETWRWREYTRDRIYYRFWGTAIQRMRIGKLARSKRYTIFVSPTHVVGEPVRIEVQAYDRELQPLRKPNLQARIRTPGGKDEVVLLKAVEGKPGSFAGGYRPEAAGEYMISVGGDFDPEDRTLETFTVTSPVLELEALNMNPETLQLLSRSTGGRYHPLREADRLEQEVKEGAIMKLRETRERDLWDTPLALLLFLLFIVTEWALRKRWGLS